MPRTPGPMLRGQRLVLNFHGIGMVPPDVGEEERPFWTTEQTFHELLDQVLPLSTSSGLAIQITFDDGNLSDLTTALPALLERGLRASFFVCAGRIGHPRYLDSTQIRGLHDAGMTVGSHGWGHVDWRTVDDATLDEELQGAREHLSDILRHAVREAAVPFGSYDRRVVRAVRRSGFHTVYTSDRGRAGRGWLVPRETWLFDWGVPQLRGLVQDRDSARQVAVRSLVRLAKRLR